MENNRTRWKAVCCDSILNADNNNPQICPFHGISMIELEYRPRFVDNEWKWVIKVNQNRQ